MDRQSEVNRIWKFLKSRLLFPLKSVAFLLYFFVIIVVVGLGSSFMGLYKTYDLSREIDYSAISVTLIGYSLVLLCSSAIEFIFISFKEDESEFTDLKNPISMIGISAIILGIFLSIFAYFTPSDFVKILIGCTMTIGVLFMWWVSNSRSLSVLSTYPPEVTDTTGGPVEEGTTQLQGKIMSEYIS